MEVSFFGMDVTIPDDPIAFIKSKAIELLNYLGYEWPVTDDSMLDAWGDKWAAIEARIAGFVAEMDAGTQHVVATNRGEFVESFQAFMCGDDSYLSSLRSIGTAAPVAAASYHGAALLIRGLRLVVLGKLLLDVVQLAAAIISGGASAGASMLIRAGVSAAINIAIDQAINQLLGAE